MRQYETPSFKVALFDIDMIRTSTLEEKDVNKDDVFA